MKNKNNKMIALQIPEDLYIALMSICEKEDVTLSWKIRQILKSHLLISNHRVQDNER